MTLDGKGKPVSFDGNGTFNQATTPVVAGTVISSTNYNSQNTDFANGLTNTVTKDGQTNPTANLKMAGYRHTGVGNAVARNDYAAAGQVQDGAFIWCGTAGGTADALTLTPTPAITAYAAGQVFRFKAGASPNTGAATVAVSGLTAQTIQKDGSALSAADIAAGKWYSLLYDGTNFQLSAWGLTIPLAVAQGGTGATDAAAARTALGLASAAYLDVSQTWAAGQTPLTAALTDAATVAWDCAAAQVAAVTTTAARTFGAPTNQVASRFYGLEITNSGGAFAHAFNAAFIFDSDDGTPGSFPASARLLLTFRSDGTSLREWGRRVVAS
jgi:hypothetical protein